MRVILPFLDASTRGPDLAVAAGKKRILVDYSMNVIDDSVQDSGISIANMLEISVFHYASNIDFDMVFLLLDMIREACTIQDILIAISLVQDCTIPIVNTLEIAQSFTWPPNIIDVDLVYLLETITMQVQVLEDRHCTTVAKPLI